MVCTNASVKWCKKVWMKRGRDTLAQAKLKVVFGLAKATEIGSDSGSTLKRQDCLSVEGNPCEGSEEDLFRQLFC